MSYTQALEAAGANVLAYEEFGSYQGDWYAKVEYKGETGWINGSFGSCSGCDAFQAEFSYDEGYNCESHRYFHDSEIGDCLACKEAKKAYLKHLAEFGEEYLGTLMSQEACENYAKEHASWSMEDSEALSWIKKNA